MTKPHKYADVIKAWADGKQVQWAHPVAPSITDPLGQREPVWGEWSWHLLGIPSFDEIYLWRVKPGNKWQKEREAFARRERVQWRSNLRQHNGIGWQDFKDSDVRSLAHAELVFNEPTNEFRIPHKWQAEMDAQARGEVIEASSDGGKTWGAQIVGRGWRFDDVDMPYRIKPKTVKTRVRVAAMGEPNGEDRLWVWSVCNDEHAAETERNQHFLRWLGDWHEVERPEPPVEDTLSVGCINSEKISAASITTEKTALGALGAMHAMGFDRAKPGADQAVFWYYGAPLSNPAINGWPHFYEGLR